MSHTTGVLQNVTPNIPIGPDSGAGATSPNTWEFNYAFLPASSGTTKYLMLNFSSATFPANNRLEVDLGYGTDVFDSSSGLDFWTRPINVDGLTAIPIRYITNGATTGGVTLAQFGRGERIESGSAANPGTHNHTNQDLFLLDDPFIVPLYETRGFCGAVNWENAACIPAADTAKTNAARASCILVMAHNGKISSCSGTLVDANLVLTAGHCFNSASQLEARSGSVTFDFQTACDRSRPSGYNPRFHKINRIVRLNTSVDYCLLQIDTPPGGLGINPIPMNTSFPAVGTQVFAVHHPIGSIKKLSREHTDPLATITSVETDIGEIEFYDIDICGGSSGSGLFSDSGELIGVNNWSGGCNNRARASATILSDLNNIPPAIGQKDVMLVFDRSGSMSLSGTSGSPKIDEAIEAAELFVQLVRSGSGDKIGMVSFSSSASTPSDFQLVDVTDTVKTNLINKLQNDLSAGGSTSIGDGLDAAQDELNARGESDHQHSILLLTDGLENTPPMISNVEGRLANTDLCIIGFGTAASLDGPLLTRLATDHNGLYTRAESGLALKKFFVLCFGNIFATGTSFDPIFHLPKGQKEAKPETVSVCAETQMTTVLGWDRPEASLYLEIITPTGDVINAATPGVEFAFGNTWTFIRLDLPFNGQQEGKWKVVVKRTNGGEFPPPDVDVDYFLDVVVKGGPRLEPLLRKRTYYTGDRINPRVRIYNDDQSVPHHPHVKLTVQVPQNGAGNLLTQNGLGQPGTIDGDNISAATNTLQELEASSSTPLITYTELTMELFDDGYHDDGAIEEDGIFGNPNDDLFKQEGTYSFHAQAEFGEDCQGRREALWNVTIKVGVDGDKTDISTEVVRELPDGRHETVVTLIPKDKYGNHVGPGRQEDLSVSGQIGNQVVPPIIDVGDGSYRIPLIWDPGQSPNPGIVLGQPDRPAVAINDPATTMAGRQFPWRLLFWLLLLLVLILLIFLILT